MDEAEKRSRWGLAPFLAAVFALWTLRVLAYPHVDERLGEGLERRLVTAGFHLGLMALPAVLFAMASDRPWAEALGLTRNLRRGFLWGGAGVALALAGYWALEALQGKPAGWRLSGYAWLTAGGTSPLSEELLFRGAIFHRLRERLPAWSANVAAAALFTAIHWPGWLLLSKASFVGLIGQSVPIFALGLLFGWVVERSGSLWPAILLHSVNNLVVMLRSSAPF